MSHGVGTEVSDLMIVATRPALAIDVGERTGLCELATRILRHRAAIRSKESRRKVSPCPPHRSAA